MLHAKRIAPLLIVLLATVYLFLGAAFITHAQTNPAGGNNGGNTPAGGNNGGNNPAGGNAGGGTTLQNPLNNINSLPELLHAILQAVVEIGSIILVLMLVYVGFLFVVARGNPEEISKARSALIWTLIGGLILLGAQAISEVVQATAAAL